ncbi:ribokinase [Leifsonia sp. F6_8S_P_1B]|uniref:Ribokinase n=1 Tax=Leifsonia williamsii TaxID=3035919 RepID=A0ABT8K5U7_9MICO|nr:ribokinase [Leifsonia williamsii]MDN4612821.1 ribokinase [Leifsonia williamsii]
MTIGSINLDHQVCVDILPRRGETVISRSLNQGVGGKGANQAVAAARAGARSALIGFIGDDAQSRGILERLQVLGVDVSGVIAVAGVPSGSALVVREVSGENFIVVNSGANAAGDLPLSELENAIVRAEVVVVQGELPPEVTGLVIDTAGRLGTRVVVNLAPVTSIGGAIRWADPLVVNEVEAAQLLDTVETDGVELAKQLRERVRSVVVTLGARGAVYTEGADVLHVPAPRVDDIVDTTGAGDATVGVLAAHLARGESLGRAVEHAVRAGSASVRFAGAAEGYPSFAEVVL